MRRTTAVLAAVASAWTVGAERADGRVWAGGARPAVTPAGDPAVRITRRTALRSTPGGRIVARVGTRTRFGSAQVVPVLRRRGAWLAVLSAARPSGAAAWIHRSRVRWVRRRPTWVAVDLSARSLRVVRAGRTVMRVRVGVGGHASPTPPGRYAVTDRIGGFGPYGCCILALSGRQPRLAAGWRGGDRLAIHGGGGIGGAVSGGCIRASDASMRRLVRLVPPGARVRVRA